MTHDKYDNDVLKQLTRIANSLEKMEKKLPDVHNIAVKENIFGEAIVCTKPKDKDTEQFNNKRCICDDCIHDIDKDSSACAWCGDGGISNFEPINKEVKND